MARAIVIIIDAVGLSIFMTVHCPEYSRLIMTASMSSMEAVAWVMKYLTEASVARGLGDFIMMGIIASMFISNPVQVNSQ